MFDSLNIFKKPENSQLSESLDQLSKDYLSSSASKKIREAIDFADKAHEGQFRKSGEPFITHPIRSQVPCQACCLELDACSFF